MGLLDALTSGSRGGYGGLLDSLFYPSPLNRREEVQQPQYDPMGNYTGITPFAPDPFGPLPQISRPTPAMFAPPSPFNNGAAPVAGLPPAMAQAPVSMPSQMAAPSQENSVNAMSIGGYQMPRVGNADLYQTQQAMTPPNAQPAQGQLPQPDQQTLPTFMSQPQGVGIGDRLNAGLQNFANAGGPLQALSGGISGLISGNRTDPQGMQQQNLRAQYESVRQALIQSGETPQAASSKAMVAALNPEAAKTILPELFTNREKYTKTGVDALGNETYGFVNERDQTINGKTLGAEGTQPAGGFLAPGVKSIDSSLTGGDYLKQFSPEVQAAVENYVQGKSMPTGNPRKGFTQTVKMVAQKYGADTNQSVDDATYAARRTMRNQLSSSSPSSLGGQINIGNTAAGHLADLSQKAIELGNVDTGIAPLTSAVNSVRGLGTEQAAKMEALKGAAQHYGQEITKFYAGSPGGTAERDRFIESVNGARSPKELAAILATEGELMRSRLDALGGQIKGVLGEEGTKQYPVLRPDGEAALAKVEQNVSKLKGGQGAATVGFTEGQTATNPKTGQTITFRGGKWQ